jgi:ribosome-binding factor A
MKLKHSPELRFLIDVTFDRIDDTRRMLAQEAVTRDTQKVADEHDDETSEEE